MELSQTALKELESEGWKYHMKFHAYMFMPETLQKLKIADDSFEFVCPVTQSGFNEFSDGLDLSEIIQQIAIERIKSLTQGK